MWIRTEPSEFISKVAAEFEKNKTLEMPEWAIFVKTGVHKEHPPTQRNWWFIRGAAVFRKIAYRGPMGVQKLRVAYGGAHRRGHKPKHFKRGSGKIVRTILQQLEIAGLIKKQKKGRILTSKGQSYLSQMEKGAVNRVKKVIVPEKKTPVPEKKAPAKKEAGKESRKVPAKGKKTPTKKEAEKEVKTEAKQEVKNEAKKSEGENKQKVKKAPDKKEEKPEKTEKKSSAKKPTGKKETKKKGE